MDHCEYRESSYGYSPRTCYVVCYEGDDRYKFCRTFERYFVYGARDSAWYHDRNNIRSHDWNCSNNCYSAIYLWSLLVDHYQYLRLGGSLSLAKWTYKYECR